MYNRTPPWASFKAVLQAIERIGTDPPGTVTVDDLPFGENYAYQVISTLRDLGFLTEDNEPTDTLAQFLKHPARRPAIMAQQLRQVYPELLEGDRGVTTADVDRYFNQFDLGKSTLRKAKTFFLYAARFAHIPIDGKATKPGAKPIAPSTTANRNYSPSRGDNDRLRHALIALIDLLHDNMTREQIDVWLRSVETTLHFYYGVPTNNSQDNLR